MNNLTTKLHTAIDDLATGLLLTDDQVATLISQRYLRRHEVGDMAGTVNATVRAQLDLRRAREVAECLLARCATRENSLPSQGAPCLRTASQAIASTCAVPRRK